MPPELRPVAIKLLDVPGADRGVTVTDTEVRSLSQLFKVWDT